VDNGANLYRQAGKAPERESDDCVRAAVTALTVLAAAEFLARHGREQGGTKEHQQAIKAPRWSARHRARAQASFTCSAKAVALEVPLKESIVDEFSGIINRLMFNPWICFWL
jgi:hypothetical protein